jgi:hypothetical protein
VTERRMDVRSERSLRITALRERVRHVRDPTKPVARGLLHRLRFPWTINIRILAVVQIDRGKTRCKESCAVRSHHSPAPPPDLVWIQLLKM